MRVLRRLLQAVVTLATVAALAVGAFALAAYRALPQTDGTIAMPKGAIAAPVTVARDERGVPTITAASEDDGYFALGYVHAQDRLFQMELMRRSGQGRLSEIVGKTGLPLDRFVRTLGLYRRAEADFAGLDPAVQRVFQRYADGVNAWLAGRDRPLPFEFQILWFAPEPWRPADSLVWQKLMGLQLSGNWDEELLRAALDARLGPERAGELFAAPRPGDPVTVETAPPKTGSRSEMPPPALPPDLEPDRLLAELLRAVTPTLASNAWAVAGSRTASGKPLLANDPHLGFQLPSLWYLAILKLPAVTLTGATVPGVPLHVLGHNGNLAWAITTTHGDTQDLFVEHALAGGNSYETPDGPRDFVTRAETIAVRFARPETIAVRETRHGPVIGDILPEARVPTALRGNGAVLALAATLLAPEDRSAEALFRMARAPDAEQFRDAARLFHAPLQNFTYADGVHIGFIAAGRVPVRRAGDGTVPAPGWNGSHDWIGWVPFASLPQAVDPPSGMIVNANNRVSMSADPLIAVHWPEAYRARRIAALLSQSPEPFTAARFAAMQIDTVSLAAREMLPLLLPHVVPRNDAEKALLADLAAWDGTMARDRAEPLVYAAWIDQLKRAILADDLGETFARYGGQRIDVLRAILADEVASPGERPGVQWCDDQATAAIETCPQRIQTAWAAALDWLAAREGGSPAVWRWDDLHRAAFDHPLFGSIPGLARLASRSIPTPGGDETIDRGSFLDGSAAHPFAHVHGPGFRAVYDLGDLGQSRFALAGGQSGHIPATHYDDLLDPWRDGETFGLTPTAPGAAGSHTLTLVPGP